MLEAIFVINWAIQFEVEVRGVEPLTPCLQSRCSPTELHPHAFPLPLGTKVSFHCRAKGFMEQGEADKATNYSESYLSIEEVTALGEL